MCALGSREYLGLRGAEFQRERQLQFFTMATRRVVSGSYEIHIRAVGMVALPDKSGAFSARLNCPDSTSLLLCASLLA